jgi:hypothetical protein
MGIQDLPINASTVLKSARIVISGYLGSLYITTRKTAKTMVRKPALNTTPILIFSPVEIRKFQRSLIGMTMTGKIC